MRPRLARARELAELSAILLRPAAVLLTGEAGVGKSHLAREGVPRGSLVARIHFPERRLAPPGAGLRRILSLGGHRAGDLRGRLDAQGAGGGPRAIREAADALVRAHAPGVLVVDDLQWADELTLAWLASAQPLIEDAGLSLVLVARSSAGLGRVADAAGRFAGSGRLDRLHLEPLDVAGVEAMLDELQLDPDPDTAAAIARRSDGLPVLVAELARAARARGALPEEASGADADEVEVPLAATSIAREETEALPVDARALAGVAAVAPQPPGESLLRTVLGFDAGRFDLALEEALESGLLARSSAGAVAFRHEMIRGAVAGLLSLSERRALHRRIARSLRAEPDPDAAAIAHQLSSAGDRRGAAAWLERAAEAAIQARAHGDALSHLSQAITHAEGSEIVRLTELAADAARAGHLPREGLRLVASTLERARPGEDRGTLLLARARLAGLGGDYRARIDALMEAADEFRRARDDRGLALALSHLSLPTDSLMPLGTRRRMGREGVRLARASGDPRSIARCAGNLAAAELSGGGIDAFELWREAEDALRSLDGPEILEERLRNIANWSIGALLFGDHASAGEVLVDGLRLAGTHADRRWERSLRAVRIAHLWRTGRWDAALEHTGEGAALRETDAAIQSAAASAISLARGGPPPAAELAGSVATLAAHGAHDWAAVAQALLVEARIVRREPSPGRGLIGVAETLVAGRTSLGWEDLLPAAAAAGAGAHRRLTTSLGDLRPLGRRARPSLLLADGLLARGEDRAEMLREAGGAFGALGEPYPQARALAAAAAARLDAGRHPGDLAVVAARILRDLGAARTLARHLRRMPRLRALEPFRGPSHDRSVWALTAREREVADLARLGATAREAAEKLGISPRTVEKHLESIKRKLGVDRKRELVRLLADDG